MPIVLLHADFAPWLEAAELSGPFPAEKMKALAVGPRVNNPRNKGEECLTPAGGQE
jgi:putative SOS response-associated peptidase YedK